MGDYQQGVTAVEYLISTLEAVYTERGKATEFAREKPVYEQLIPQLLDNLHPLKLVRAFALGSTATIWEVEDDSLNQRRALKLPRPTLSKLDKIIRVIRAETNKLSEIRHQNIINIHLSREIKTKIDNEEYYFPYFLTDYIEGVKDLDEYIKDNLTSLNATDVISCFRQVALGLDVLHEKGIIHCDIKPGNIFKAPKSPAIVADLGYAKHFVRIPKESEGKMTTVTYTPLYAHPKLLEHMTRSTDSAANIAEIKYSQLTPSFDLYAFGRTIQTILQLIHEKECEGKVNIFSPYQWRYLALIAVRLLDGQVTSVKNDPLKSDVIPGLPPSMMQELAYKSADEVLEDLEKLLNLYDLEGQIPELNSNLNSYIQVAGTRVPLTKRVSRIINHPIYSRLNQVTQLGFVSMVYPGATHTRFEHSLGTFEKCCEIVKSLWYDNINCLFRSVMSSSDIEALLLASILHDIGQYPMAHDLTEVDKSLAHDRFTESLIETLDPYTGESIDDIIRSEWNASTEYILSVLKADKKSAFKHRVLGSIINGPIDADKQDYIRRDALHAGVTFGLDIDYNRLIPSLTVCVKTVIKDDEPTLELAELGVAEKAHAVADSIWRARQEMFRQVYWHHTVRALKAMLTYVVRRILMNFADDEAKNDFYFNLHQFCLSPLLFCQGLSDSQDSDYLLIKSDVESSFIPDDSIYLTFSQLSPSDDALISFLWKYSDNVGRNMLQMIRRRQVYKRIAVVSKDRNQGIFDSIYNRFRHDRLEGRIRPMERRRHDLEQVILSNISNPEAIFEERGRTPIVLIDVPIKALKDPSDEEVLCYVPEGQLESTHKDVFSAQSIAESSITLEKTVFDSRVGKIRVLAHPYFYEDIKNQIGSTSIIEYLTSTLGQAYE